jgi:hypothetical protein
VAFLGHTIEAMKRGEMKNVMFVARESLLLERMSRLSDGVSFLLEANPKTDQTPTKKDYTPLTSFASLHNQE